MPNPDAESLAQGVVERLSEDETLRGDLTDEGFGPLLQWAVDAAIAYAGTLEGDKPEEQMEAFGSRLKAAVQAVVEAADAGRLEDFAPFSELGLSQIAAAKDKLLKLKLEKDKADANAVQLSQVLSQALTEANNSPAKADPGPPESTSVAKVDPKPAESTSVAKAHPSPSTESALQAKINQQTVATPLAHNITPEKRERPLFDPKAILNVMPPGQRPRISGRHALRRKKGN